MDETYKIVRKYRNDGHPDEVIKTGLTLAEAREHCSSDDTHEPGVWMDVFYKEDE